MTDMGAEEPVKLTQANNKDSGYTLVEIILVLVILGILVPSFLGIMLSFTRYNQNSRLYMTAGAAAGNIYEKAKSLSVPELSALAAARTIVEDHMLFRIEAERYITDVMSSKANYIDMVIRHDSNNGFYSYAYGDSIQELFSVAGQGLLSVMLNPGNDYIDVSLSDASGRYAEYQFPANKDKLIINIHAIKMPSGQQVKINIGRQPQSDWEIYIYEQPLHNGNISIICDGQVFHTFQMIKSVRLGNISVFSRKTEAGCDTPVYLKVEAYRQDTDNKPLSCRQGIIAAQP
ncbi:MAG TPA: type II secretion system protein [Clostridiales bacterium]|nr:type II secretion system protein [Clostridiales bacterium]